MHASNDVIGFRCTTFIRTLNHSNVSDQPDATVSASSERTAQPAAHFAKSENSTKQNFCSPKSFCFHVIKDATSRDLLLPLKLIDSRES